MKFTLSWLKEHLETSADTAEIARRMTALGLEVESIADRVRDFAPFVVAYVVEAKPHPNADRLRLCLVDTGKERVQVVCGAPNARTGMKGVFAPAGSHIPGTGLDLKAGVIRGEASNGMLCSMREMGLSDEHEGIIELPADADEATREQLGFLFGGVIYRLGDSLFGLRPVGADRFAEDRTGLDHLSFAVDSVADLEAAASMLEDRGITHSGVKDIGAGHILEFRDPDNIALELFAPKLVSQR